MLFDQLKEDYEKTKTGLEKAISQLQKTLRDNNREIENAKGGTLLFFSIKVKIKFIIIWKHRLDVKTLNIVLSILLPHQKCMVK